MENISKVLRQLPEKPLRWLLQEFMKDGIPTQFEDLKNGQCEYFIYGFKLEVFGRFIYLAGNEIYDRENGIPILKPITYRDPTQEEVKAIYEGVFVIKGLRSRSIKHELDLSNIDLTSFDTNEEVGDANGIVLFQKGKGFALPISWKEEEEWKALIELNDSEIKDLKRVRNYFGENDITTLEHFGYSFLDSLLKKIEKPLDIFKDGNDTNISTIEETPEQKGKRIEESNITELFKRVQALEDYIGIKSKKQPVKEFKVGDKVVVNEKYNKNFKPNHKGVITEIDHTNFPFEIDGYSWVKQDEIQHAPKEVESVETVFRIGDTYISQYGCIVLCLGSGIEGDNSFSGICITIGESVHKQGEFLKNWAKYDFTPYTLPNQGEIV